MQCANCGASIAEKAIVCYRCGAPTALPAESRKPQPSAPRVRWLVVVVVVVAAALVGVGVWYFSTCCGA